MKKEEVQFGTNLGALSYGDIVEVVSGEFENGAKKFLIIQSDHSVAILIDLDKSNEWNEWNRFADPVRIPSWVNLNTENFANIFGFDENAKVRIVARKTTLVYEYLEEINVGDTIRVKEFPFICGHVVYKTKSEPALYFINEYQEGRVGLSESEIEKVST